MSDNLKNLLNEAIAREMQVSIQYMWQHVQLKGIRGFTIRDELKKIAIEEMKHAEKIAERLVYLGGKPTTKPEPIFVGDTLEEMIKQDIQDEEKAIKLYTEIINLAKSEGDIVTAKIFEEILEEEQKHHDFFTSIMEVE